MFLLGADDMAPSDIPADAFVVYQGHHGDVGANYADVVLPSAAYTEKTATYVNTEGRAQLTTAAVTPPTGAREDWTIIRALSEVAGVKLPYDNIEELQQRTSEISPSLVAIDNLDPVSKQISQEGMKLFNTYKESSKGFSLNLPIKDYYLTNSISRASSTMAKCSQVFIE
jgi:NADH dehydrogenase (ubiquinone) Fe-S protein 1